MWNLPVEPRVDRESLLGRWLLSLGEQGGNKVVIPPLIGLHPLVVVRWLYRSWLAEEEAAGRGWRPLLHVDLRRAAGVVWPELLAIGEGGWLFVEEGVLPPGLAEEAARREIRLWVAGEEGTPIPLSESLRGHLTWLDRFHLVATDPSLAGLRRSLISHCRSNSPVHLSGPVGSGRQSLAFWAHATLDNRPLSQIRRGGQRRPIPGQWELYQEVGELEKDQIHYLRERLKAMEPRPPSFEPEGPRVERPRTKAFEAIIGESPALSRVLADAARVAPSSIPVLILGESGCGKESLARALHDASGRSGAYVALDLTAANENLVEDQLFGHVKGAYTGVESTRIGAFREADGGTLFLDELGNLSPKLQAKLLRVLQEKMVQPLGSDKLVRVDVRVVAATNADLEGMIARGEFREDLYQRLRGVELRLPPLRQRRGDILLLAEHFYRQARRRETVPSTWLEEDAREALNSWPWPGNIRELANVIELAAVTTEGRRVRVSDLGALDPVNRRPAPLLTTSSEGPASWGMEKELVQRLTAVTLKIPPLQDRGARCVRNAILGLLDGRPIRSDVLVALERRPWWGNFPELEMAMAAIRSNLECTVDPAGLRQALPTLLAAGGREPLLALQNPVRLDDGRVTGMEWEYPEGALLVGRLSSLRELEAGAGDPKVDARLQAVRAVLGTVRPACLNLAHLDFLSRAHFVVTREEGGLKIHALPRVSAPILAGSLGGGPLRELQPGSPLLVGAAGEVLVKGPRGTQLQLFLFAGAVAREEFAGVALQRVGTPKETMFQQGAPVEAETEKSRVWALDSTEIRLLTELMVRHPGRNFSNYIKTELEARRHEPGFGRLCPYIADSPRPTQYCQRIYEFEPNRGALAALAAAFMRLPDGRERASQLPSTIATLLLPLMG
jgi:MoxR-like ATPase